MPALIEPPEGAGPTVAPAATSRATGGAGTPGVAAPATGSIPPPSKRLAAAHLPLAHPLRNGEVDAVATPFGVWLAGGRIDALAASAGEILTTCPRGEVSGAIAHVEVAYGVAQVRRHVAVRSLALLHLVFAPARPRPLLLGLVRLRNLTRSPLLVHYSELWAIDGAPECGAEGACAGAAAGRICALADVSAAIRARPPLPLPESGLALDARIVLPPSAVRQLAFAYVATEPGTDPATLVRAWRGDVANELARTVAGFADAAPDDPIAAYLASVASHT
jgi:hypothetical protein